MQKLPEGIPKPLFEDMLDDHCVPIIGAGFSRNAELPAGLSMPLWKELGDMFANEIEPNCAYSNPVDSISAYEHEFERVKLVEKLNEFLHVEEAQPGAAHKAFCKLPFRTVITTNFDFLLEKAYSLVPRYCHTIIADEELSVKPPQKAIVLLKLHGDLCHPDRMIVSENDYDLFLERHRLFATYLSNLFISKTPLFIGYSLEDPDFRQILQIIHNRLGKLRRPAYALLVEPTRTDIKRFERRGVRVIDIKKSSNYNQTLAKLFNHLEECLLTSTINESIPMKEDTRVELSLPLMSLSRLCLFSVPSKLESFYQKYVFPLVQKFGFVPSTIRDIESPGNIIAKEMALVNRAEVLLIDLSSETAKDDFFLSELLMRPDKRVIIVAESGSVLPFDIRKRVVVIRPKNIFDEYEDFLAKFESAFYEMTKDLRDRLGSEPNRLMENGEYRAAFIFAMTLLESEVRNYVIKKDLAKGKDVHLMSLGQMVSNIPIPAELKSRYKEIFEWVKWRNAILHHNEPIKPRLAKKYVVDILEILRTLQKKSD